MNPVRNAKKIRARGAPSKLSLAELAILPRTLESTTIIHITSGLFLLNALALRFRHSPSH
jgi:hypothetical protein